MHQALLDQIVKVCRQRQQEGDHPTAPAESVETLENAVVMLADQVAKAQPRRSPRMDA